MPDTLFVLLANRMTHAHVEQMSVVCYAETEQELVDLLDKELVEPYRDGQWAKTFRKGGPLEWYNRPCEYSDGSGITAVVQEPWPPAHWSHIEDVL